MASFYIKKFLMGFVKRELRLEQKNIKMCKMLS